MLRLALRLRLKRVITFKDVNTLCVWGVFVGIIGRSEEASFWFLHPRSTLTCRFHSRIVFHWNIRSRRNKKGKKSDSFEGKHIHEEKMCCCGDGDYLLCPSLLPQTTQLREDLQQLEEQKDKYIWKISGIHICVFLSCYAACLACQGRSSQPGSPISGFGFCVIYSGIMLMLNRLKVTLKDP